jgi:uncharacterized protein (DUF1810 family)
MGDRYGLGRFLRAQEPVYDQVVQELRGGQKVTHWMWFVFPQFAGLGRSPMSRLYAIASADEARAYLAHAVLGPRLLECSGIVAGLEAGSAAQIFGALDAAKLRSSMTLFMRAAPEEPTFSRVIDRYFEGRPDAATDELLAASP